MKSSLYKKYLSIVIILIMQVNILHGASNIEEIKNDIKSKIVQSHELMRSTANMMLLTGLITELAKIDEIKLNTFEKSTYLIDSEIIETIELYRNVLARTSIMENDSISIRDLKKISYILYRIEKSFSDIKIVQLNKQEFIYDFLDSLNFIVNKLSSNDVFDRYRSYFSTDFQPLLIDNIDLKRHWSVMLRTTMNHNDGSDMSFTAASIDYQLEGDENFETKIAYTEAGAVAFTAALASVGVVTSAAGIGVVLLATSAILQGMIVLPALGKFYRERSKVNRAVSDYYFQVATEKDLKIYFFEQAKVFSMIIKPAIEKISEILLNIDSTANSEYLFKLLNERIKVINSILPQVDKKNNNNGSLLISYDEYSLFFERVLLIMLSNFITTNIVFDEIKNEYVSSLKVARQVINEQIDNYSDIYILNQAKKDKDRRNKIMHLMTGEEKYREFKEIFMDNYFNFWLASKNNCAAAIDYFEKASLAFSAIYLESRNNYSFIIKRLEQTPLRQLEEMKKEYFKIKNMEQ